MERLDWLPSVAGTDHVRSLAHVVVASLTLAVALLVLDDVTLGEAFVTGAVFAVGYLLIHLVFRRL